MSHILSAYFVRCVVIEPFDHRQDENLDELHKHWTIGREDGLTNFLPRKPSEKEDVLERLTMGGAVDQERQSLIPV